MEAIKVIKGILLTLIILIIGLLTIGLSWGELEYHTEIEIDAPAEDVWKFLQNPGKMEKWIDNFQGIEMLSGEIGEVGSEYKLVFGDDEEEYVNEKLTDVVENKQIGFDIFNDMIKGHVEINLTPTATGTILKSTTKYSGEGAFMHAVFVFMNGSLKEIDRLNYERFKQIVEN